MDWIPGKVAIALWKMPREFTNADLRNEIGYHPYETTKLLAKLRNRGTIMKVPGKPRHWKLSSPERNRT